MVDDDLEVIDLTDEEDPRAGRPRNDFRPSRTQLVAGLACAVLVAAGAIALTHHTSHPSSSHRNAAAPTTADVAPADTDPPLDATTPPPQPLVGIAPGDVVEIVAGSPILVGQDGATRSLLSDISENAVVDISQSDEVLIGYPHSTTRVIVGTASDGTRDALPAAYTLLPDATGRWWSNFGLVDGPSGPQVQTFPTGTAPVAKLDVGYLLVNREHTVLDEWQPGQPLVRIASGDNARVIAIASSLVAWSTDDGTVHVTNLLLTGDTTDIAAGGFAVTARFSPDRSRIAILTSRSSDSMVLADPVSGAVITHIPTAAGGGGLPVFSDVPPAFEPAPFGWDSAGQLLAITSRPGGRFVETFNARDGSAVLTVAAPDGLEQAIPLLP